ncbi:hypothetical protein PsorP6_006152 [Peronosclerospora sorghi]|uniref:Uncharacterized protein n=1 Tax=Peronosclerospora sorghi TaxID=230839 RepID=A0ACC0W580_9STRA|nr:hypothetical protein PsorP6_006152 [Peronosclerospora sorghi]
MAHWWRRDQVMALLHAWEQTVDPPRDRDELTRDEMQQLYAHFNTLRPRDGPAVAIFEVEAQRQRLVRTFLFLRAFNGESIRAGRPTWFQLPVQQQDDLRRMNNRLGDLAVVAQDEFDHLRRICDDSIRPDTPVERSMADEMKAAAEALAGLPMFVPNERVGRTFSPPLSPLQRTETPLSSDHSDPASENETKTKRVYEEEEEEESDEEVDTRPKVKSKVKIKMTSKWSKRDELRLIEAWHEIVTTLATNGYAGSYASRNDGLRLNALIHQRYVELCCDGGVVRTNQSTGAKKHAIMMAFRSLRNVLRTLASQRERPNWFGMTPDERMELQKMYGHHHEHTCFIEKETYQRLGEIDRAQRVVLTPIPNALRAPVTLDQLLRRSHQKIPKKFSKGKHSMGSTRNHMVVEEPEEEDSSDEDASSQSGRNEDSSPMQARRPRFLTKERSSREVNPVETTSPSKRPRTGLSNAKWVTRLLDAQTQRFESFLAEFQEERRQERQHNMEIILEALKLRRASIQQSNQPSKFAEMLVEKQRQQMLRLFNQLQEERSQERDQARMLLRELGAARLVSQNHERKD